MFLISLTTALSVVTPHKWHHLEFGLYVIVILFLLYFPPASFCGLSNIRDFIERHFGDSIGLYLLHLGIALVILAGVFQEMTLVGNLGQSLVLAAMGILKLKTVPSDGTNGTNVKA